MVDEIMEKIVEQKKSSLIVIKIPRELHDKIKVIAVKQGIKMNRLNEILIEYGLKKYEEEQPKI